VGGSTTVNHLHALLQTCAQGEYQQLAEEVLGSSKPRRCLCCHLLRCFLALTLTTVCNFVLLLPLLLLLLPLPCFGSASLFGFYLARASSFLQNMAYCCNLTCTLSQACTCLLKPKIYMWTCNQGNKQRVVMNACRPSSNAAIAAAALAAQCAAAAAAANAHAGEASGCRAQVSSVFLYAHVCMCGRMCVCVFWVMG